MTQWELHLNSIGDANCRPAVRRAAERVARRARRRARRGRAAQARDEPAPGLRREDAGGARRARGRAEDRRVALRRLPRALRRRAPPPRRSTASRTSSTRRSCAASTTTRARRSSSSGPTRTPTRRSAAAAATTGSSSRSAARRRPAIGFGAGLERLLLALENEGEHRRAAGRRRLLRRRRTPPRATMRCALVAELRRAGVSADTDYAGRSLKGQLTQAGRSGARTVVDRPGGRRGDPARRARRAVVALDEVVATLTA